MTEKTYYIPLHMQIDVNFYFVCLEVSWNPPFLDRQSWRSAQSEMIWGKIIQHDSLIPFIE